MNPDRVGRSIANAGTLWNNAAPPSPPEQEPGLDLRYSESDEKFRGELRSWLAEAVPAHGDPPPRDDWPGRREYDCGW